jgi:hypothetical protein
VPDAPTDPADGSSQPQSRTDVDDQSGTTDGRNETPVERLDRQFQDLLQELRVSQAGVQILFAFLLGIAFTQAFSNLDDWQRGVYVGTLVATALATVFFNGPVSFHRIVFRRKLRESLVYAANWMAITGLALLLLAMCGAMFLVVTVVLGRTWATWVAAGLFLAFVVVWYAIPLIHRQRGDRRRDADT